MMHRPLELMTTTALGSNTGWIRKTCGHRPHVLDGRALSNSLASPSATSDSATLREIKLEGISRRVDQVMIFAEHKTQHRDRARTLQSGRLKSDREAAK